MAQHLFLLALEFPSSETVVSDSLLDMICLDFDNKPENRDYDYNLFLQQLICF